MIEKGARFVLFLIVGLMIPGIIWVASDSIIFIFTRINEWNRAFINLSWIYVAPTIFIISCLLYLWHAGILSKSKTKSEDKSVVMSPAEAEEIVINYTKVIDPNLRPSSLVQPITNLPYSPGKIKYAHFLYAEYLIKEGRLTTEIGDSLIKTFGYIEGGFVEDAKGINKKYREYLKKLDEGIILKDCDFAKYTAPIEMELEFNNFLADCQGKWNKQK